MLTTIETDTSYDENERNSMREIIESLEILLNTANFKMLVLNFYVKRKTVKEKHFKV